jgi:hypothetical protein
MPLKKIPLKPGFNKQDTATAAEGQWIDGDFVRFRYGYPEKIGGWEQTLRDRLAGAAREILTWVSISGNRYAAIGTNKCLFIYFDGQFYDITPLGTALTSCTLESTTGSATVTVTKNNHGLNVGDYIRFTSPSLAGGGVTTFTSPNFTTNTFEVISVPSTSTFTVTMPVTEAGTGMSGGGSTITTTPYVEIGPAFQTLGYGWGTGVWGSFSGGPGWGQATTSAITSLSPGLWSFDNFGQILIATVRNGKTFKWDPSAAGALTTRATVIANAPTASVMTIVSDIYLHLEQKQQLETHQLKIQCL